MRKALIPQSIDIYYDFASDGYISSNRTFRKRIKTSKFMTWAEGEDQVSPLNLELPMVQIATHGLTARLEFNWLDNPETCLKDVLQQSSASCISQNPLLLMAKIHNYKLSALYPAIEHETRRAKYKFCDNKDEKFVLNIDYIKVKDLNTGKVAEYNDVDISSLKPIDSNELIKLYCFSKYIADIYELEPLIKSKALYDKEILSSFS